MTDLSSQRLKSIEDRLMKIFLESPLCLSPEDLIRDMVPHIAKMMDEHADRMVEEYIESQAFKKKYL